MPNVVIHRPGHRSPHIDPDTGVVDQDWIDWSFNATVDGQLGVVSAIFSVDTSESDAASKLHRQLVMEPDTLEGILSTGGGGDAAGGASGPAGGDGSGVVRPPEKVKTNEGGSTSTQGGGGGGGAGGGGAQGPAGAGEGGGVIVTPPKMKTEDGT